MLEREKMVQEDKTEIRARGKGSSVLYIHFDTTEAQPRCFEAEIRT